MTDTGKMAALLRRLKVEMNGAVVDSMRERGVNYPLSYGVSVPTIREAAAEYAPDHKLAKLLYRQEVRELRLAAMTIADPEAVTLEELGFWGEGVINTEVGEHLAVSLLSGTKIVPNVLLLWLESGNDLMKYAALLTAARKLASSDDYDWFDWDRTRELLLPVLGSEEGYLWRGASRLLERTVDISPIFKNQVAELMNEAEQLKLPSADYMREEIGWLLP